MSEQFALILTELQKLNARVTNIENVMATKDDITSLAARMATKDDVADLPFIRQAVLATNENVKLLMNNQQVIFETLEKHEMAICNLNEQTSKILKVIRI